MWKALFSSGNFEPHGYCYLWNAGLVWLNVISDGLIALSYFAIPVALIWFIRKRRDLPFSWMFLLFGTFIVACGTTHVMEVWNLWHANYWLAGVIKAITAAASVPTAILLASLVPRALQLPSAKELAATTEALREEIAERREVELELRISEASYRQQADLLQLTHDAIFVRDPMGKISFWNLGAERLYGWTKDEVRGQTTHSLLQTVFPKPLPQILAETEENGSWEGELIHTKKDGSKLFIASRWSLQRDSEGRIYSFLESNRDITQRRRVEKKFRDLLESSPDATVIVDQSGKINLVNAQTEKLFGYTREELTGKPVELLMPERFQRGHAQHRKDYAGSPRTRYMGVGLQLYGKRRDGTEFPVEVSLSPLQTDEGMLAISAVRDVTERHRAEEKIHSLNAELKQKLVELSAVNKELETFSYSVSHDLRAPLRHIDGFTRILLEEHESELSVDAKKYLNRVLQAVTHTGHLVDDLLNLARIGRKELQRQNVMLGDVVQRVIGNLGPDIATRNIHWKIQDLPATRCDPGLAEVVFMNLLSNAVKFTRNNPFALIEVGITTRNGAATFFVRDNGVGFDPKYADKLFGVFQRLHQEEEFEGTGVGLATVQRIVHRHGGDIWAESKPGQGTTFFFTLDDPQPANGSKAAHEVRHGIN